jgi:hypothetical protein
MRILRIMMAAQSSIESQITFKMTRGRLYPIVAAILALMVVAEFATLMSGPKQSACRSFHVNPECLIRNCSFFAEIQCNNVILNLTSEEFDSLHDISCGAKELNVSCSFTKQVDAAHLFHVEYAASECGTICKFFQS